MVRKANVSCSIFVNLLVSLFLFVLLVHASPLGVTRSQSSRLRRQVGAAPYTGPSQVQTVQTSNTVIGTLTTTCDVTLTPVTDEFGDNFVLEEQSCEVSINGSGQNNNNNNGGITSSSTTEITGGTTTESTSDTSSTSLSDTGTTGTGSPVIVLGPSSVSSTDVSTVEPGSSLTTSADPAEVTSAEPDTSAGTEASANLPTPTTADNTATVAAEQASTSSTAAFQLPGQKLQVLPIGLGVFAGISVIALIVVALVTYERTKYRKTFRKRKLAEAGANMGYGGMSERG